MNVELSITRTRDILTSLTQADDGAHLSELIELVDGISDENDVAADEAMKILFTLTPDFQHSYQAWRLRIRNGLAKSAGLLIAVSLGL